jgi:hypothetical protein
MLGINKHICDNHSIPIEIPNRLSMVCVTERIDSHGGGLKDQAPSA